MLRWLQAGVRDQVRVIATADVVQAAARVAGFPAAPVIAALAAKRGEKPADPGAAFAAYVDAAEQLARWLDQWTAP